ncbi:MAG TPA: EAL domain-containing protein [Terracidiphilus sp.]|nr:EAL domain-containing protein [Terracidiphilus sp.]
MATPTREFAHGLESGQFVPCFQPVVLLRTGELTSFEVLARWRHPQLGTIPPDTFVPLAEAEEWIGDLMVVVARQAFQAASALPYSIRLSLNISAVQLRDDSLPEQIERVANRVGFPLEQVSIEIAESALRTDLGRVRTIAARLKAMGCWIELDDFGAGDSTLRHVQSLPLDALKLDRSYVQSMMGHRESRRMVEAALGVGQSLRIRTVAKGVETAELAEMLFQMGCDMGQGSLYGEPVPLEELAEVSRMPGPAIAGQSWLTNLLPAGMSPGKRLAQFQAIYDGAPVGLGFLDRQLRFVRVNRGFAEMHGIAVEAHIGRAVAEVVPEFWALVERDVKRALEGEGTGDVEITGPRGGSFLLSFEPALDEAGEVVGVSLAVMGVTGRGRAELAGAGKQRVSAASPGGELAS